MAEVGALTRDLLRLQAWLSPAFPIGGFSYSHGLEEAVAAAVVTDADGLFSWTEAVVGSGGGRVDAMLLVEVWRAVDIGEVTRLIRAAETGGAMRGTSELAIESTAQGEAFLETAQAAWPEDSVAAVIAELEGAKLRTALPVAVGVVAACHDVPLEAVLPMYLQSFCAGIVSAGVRLIPLGQTDGQRVIARLQPVVERAASAAILAEFEDIGGASPVIDLASMAHETRDGRLFRS
ncbi:MAG: urease accessory protein UreF [Dehalococcoidia bacterium]|nr:urease accessory protein UreF [Dehalococcoidia bacterium]